MMIQDEEVPDREERLQAALIELLEAAEAGTPPDRQTLMTRFPDLADDLIKFLEDRERLNQLAAPFRLPIAGNPIGTFADDRTLGPNENQPRVLGSSIHYFGDYELLDEIARGGMGIVYKARQKSLKRIVALKMILTGQLASSEDVKRFYAEAEAAAKLEHPNIVPIYEIGQAEGQHYFSMALVDGESLAHRVAREVIAPKEAASIMQKVARAIAYAHVEGVVHRDLKPANILLDTAGEPHVTDFGLAKRYETAGAANEASQLTATVQVLGTPSYMPPEQASGKVKSIGPLSDVYSLGAVLYCLITGRSRSKF